MNTTAKKEKKVFHGKRKFITGFTDRGTLILILSQINPVHRN
jgi:hypothetical protein